MTRTAIALLLVAACGGSSGPHFAQDAGLPGNKACQLDWIDSRGDQRELRTFDDRGQLVHAVWSWVGGAEILVEDFTDDDRDQLVDARYTDPTGATIEHDSLVYDEHHRLARWEEDGDSQTGTRADGTLDVDAFYTYDPTGHLARIDYDDNGDGVPEPAHYELITWDANGCATGDDVYAPGARDRQAWIYLPGCLLAQIDHDDGADGTIDAIEAWTYDARGRLAAEHTIDGGDRSYRYDDQDRVTEMLTSNATETFTYCPGVPASLTNPDSPRARTPGRAWNRTW